MSSTTVTMPADLRDGEHRGIEHEGQHILICKVSGQYFATTNICSHARVLLSKGKLRGHQIICPLHGARFDVRDGSCLAGPTQQPLSTYSVEHNPQTSQLTLEIVKP